MSVQERERDETTERELLDLLDRIRGGLADIAEELQALRLVLQESTVKVSTSGRRAFQVLEVRKD